MEEKIFFKNKFGDDVCGILHHAEQKSTIGVIIAHGFTGRKDRKLYLTSAAEFAKHGWNALRFDFTGSGESTSKPLSVESHVDELKNAIKFMKAHGNKKIILIGESMAAYYIMLLPQKSFDEVVFWAPRIKEGILSVVRTNPKLWEEIEQSGQGKFTFKDREFTLTKDYLQTVSSYDYQQLLKKFNHFAFIIQGTKDDKLEVTKSVLGEFGKGAKLIQIEGAPHPLNGFEEEVAKVTANYLEELIKMN